MKNSKFKKRHIGMFFVLNTMRRFHRDEVFSSSAEAAYYLIMGFIPFMIFLVNAVLFFMAPQISVIIKVLDYLPQEVAVILSSNIYRIIAARSSTWLAAGLLIALWAVAQGVQVLIRASDQTFHENRDQQNWFIVKIKSMVLVVFLTLSIIVSLGFTVFGNAVIYAVNYYFYLPELFLQIWDWIKYILPFGDLILTLTIFYRFAPDTLRPKWYRAFFVSIFITIVWLLVTSVYSYYILNISNMGFTYGPLMGIIVLFIWFRFIAMAIIMGSEILMTWQDFEVLRRKHHRKEPENSI